MFCSLPILVCVRFPDAARAGGARRGLRTDRGGADGGMRLNAAAADWTPPVTSANPLAVGLFANLCRRYEHAVKCGG